MERGNPRESIDKLALTKAAAWAWYQRGSGSEGRPVSEYNPTRSRRAPTPSRYKFEAIRTTREAAKEVSKSTPQDDNSHLLDKYEIERISRQLEYYMEVSDVEYNRGMHKSTGKKSKRTKRYKWLKHGVGCSSGNDVVEFAMGFREPPSRRLLPENNHRRRTTHAH
ncbi:hypothetical protein Acr_09g0005710 [Actinidia rufa]|uniref:Uncharacterized protein n=1 Tax=Actinidia rufa TaxID=165716 RepID=A0A7J0F7B9_9ERIC|nr:hypothetical protein Acr_09g0005650 [Actinidia rufa]GFY94125.1 hypothetical protein Acr_09g0005710 [Actinidia rufa]